MAIDAVRKSADALQRFARFSDDIKVSEKKPKDFVTNADLLSEKIVLEQVAESYPDDGVLSEERGVSGNQNSCWVLDPIDGTTNFVNGLPAYAISLAWCKDGVPELGVILDVARDDIYYAERGRGAFCNKQRIRVSGKRKYAHALIGSTGSPGTRNWRWPFLAELAKKTIGVRRMGSGALDFAWAACGGLDAVFGANLKYWDYAAGGLLVTEANGVFFSDLDSEDPVPFGSQLKTITYGSPRIAGQLRREAIAFRDAEAENS